MSEHTKVVRVRVLTTERMPDGTEQEVELFSAEAPEGFTEQDFVWQMSRPLTPMYEGPPGSPQGFKQTGPITFGMMVKDRRMEGKKIP